MAISHEEHFEEIDEAQLNADRVREIAQAFEQFGVARTDIGELKNFPFFTEEGKTERVKINPQQWDKMKKLGLTDNKGVDTLHVPVISNQRRERLIPREGDPLMAKVARVVDHGGEGNMWAAYTPRVQDM